MGALVGYASSDDDDDVSTRSQEVESQPVKAEQVEASEAEGNQSKPAAQASAPASSEPSNGATTIGPSPQNAAPLGPAFPPLEEPSFTTSLQDDISEPSSPYTTNRAIIQDLTLPSVPDLDIPPSPPGVEPPPSTNAKFAQFLTLKKQGTHFNAKLEGSTALRNPSLMDKLLGFVDVEEGDQYATTLGRDVWNPEAFPDWAYRERLRKTREKVAKEREAEKASGSRTAVDFVSSSSGSAAAQDPQAGGLQKGEKRRSDWK